MPFWIGMLTEDQHPHRDLQQAVKQASWNLYFADNPVCEPPDFVDNPGFDLDGVLREQKIQLLVKANEMNAGAVSGSADVKDVIRAIRSEKHQSWVNLRKAVRSLLNLPHEPFGSKNVAANSKTTIRRMLQQTGVTPHRLKDMLDSM